MPSTSEAITVPLPCSRRASPRLTTATAPARSTPPSTMTRADRRRAWLVAVLAAIALLTRAPRLPAQAPSPWRVSDCPYLIGDPTNGILLIGHIQYAREADYDANVP